MKTEGDSFGKIIYDTLIFIFIIAEVNLRPIKMPNLKLIAMRLKSVKNIQKITQSMKMVSAAKFAKAERDLKSARPLGVAAQQFYKSAEV